MNTAIDDRRPQVQPGKWPALMLAIAVHVVFIAVLVFSVRWQSRKPEPVMAELYAPPVKGPVVETPRPEPTPPPVEKPPEPRPEPIVEPPKPSPPVETPDQRAAEIALKARQEEERRRLEQAEMVLKARQEIERRRREQAEIEKKEAERKRQEEQKRIAEARERQAREAQALKAQAEREATVRAQQQAQRDALVRAEQQAERDALAMAQAQELARARAMDDYIRRIQTKVRGNVIVPGDIAGNPTAEFEVVQLPTGEIIDVRLRRSSGFASYDAAVERAIHKSSPLPRPSQADLWQRVLTLQFRPRE